MPGRTLNVGTRGSKLALEQARRVRERLPGRSELCIVKTSGDRFQEKPLHEQDGVGFFTKEIEQQLIAGNIDLAVHSLKDLPVRLAPGLMLAAVLERDEASDMLLVRPDWVDDASRLCLRPGARVGASSLRRQALLKALNSRALPAPIRGNVPTRVDKLRLGDHDAIVLARAGLSRLGLDTAPLAAFDLNPHRWICAPGQGAIAVEAREDDDEVLERLKVLDHALTRQCVQAERELLLVFGGGCHAPFGAYASLEDGVFCAFVAAPGRDGVFRMEGFQAGRLDDARALAERWIRAGCPLAASGEEEEWLVRPARPWC
jgi:hydroxymethylbilane synthase